MQKKITALLASVLLAATSAAPAFAQDNTQNTAGNQTNSAGNSTSGNVADPSVAGKSALGGVTGAQIAVGVAVAAGIAAAASGGGGGSTSTTTPGSLGD